MMKATASSSSDHIAAVAERNVFAIINTRSGERAAAEFVREQLEMVLGERRRLQCEARRRGGVGVGVEAALSANSHNNVSPSHQQQQQQLFNSSRPESVVHVLAFERKTWREEAIAFLSQNILKRGHLLQSPTDNNGGGGGNNNNTNAVLCGDTADAAGSVVPNPHRRTNSVNVLGQSIRTGGDGQQQQQATASPIANAAASPTVPMPPPLLPPAEAAAADGIGSMPNGPVENILIVAGGDGTVALAADLLNETGLLDYPAFPFPSPSCGEGGGYRNGNGGGASSSSALRIGFGNGLNSGGSSAAAAAANVSYCHDDFSVHISVIPMGTGNDLSRSLGFGPGFVRGGVGPFAACCEMTTMRPIIEQTLAGRPVDFDLWTISAKPLLGAGAIIGGVSGRGLTTDVDAAVARNVKNTNCPANAANSEQSQGLQQQESLRGDGGEELVLSSSSVGPNGHISIAESSGQNEGEVVGREYDTATAASLSNVPVSPTAAEAFAGRHISASGHSGTPVADQTVTSPVSGSGPNADQQKAMPSTAAGAASPSAPASSQSSLLKFNFVNYFSVGFDARICTEFHHLRQAHPSLCSSRLLNKAWYGILGLKTLVGEPIINAKYVMLRVDRRLVPIPPDVKSVVISNVISFAGGVTLWRKPSSTKQYTDAEGRPVGSRAPVGSISWPEEGEGEGHHDDNDDDDHGGVNGGRGGNSDGANVSNGKSGVGAYEEASVGDGLLEVQGLFGSIHMSMLQLKARHSVKIAQGRRIELTIMYPELLEAYHRRRNAALARAGSVGGSVPAGSSGGTAATVAPSTTTADAEGQPYPSVHNKNVAPTPVRSSAAEAYSSVGRGDSVDAIGTPSTVAKAPLMSATTPNPNTYGAHPYSPEVSPGDDDRFAYSAAAASATFAPLPPPSLRSRETAGALAPAAPVLSAADVAALPPPLATQLDGEAMPKIEAMLKEYGAVTFLITRRQRASMLTLEGAEAAGSLSSSTGGSNKREKESMIA